MPPDPAIPGGAAENARPTGVMRSGTVPASQPGQVVIEALRATVLADAAAPWQRTDSPTLQVSVEDVTWNDASLGCPMPGQMYAPGGSGPPSFAGLGGTLRLIRHGPGGP
jgi:hypothetical protein